MGADARPSFAALLRGHRLARGQPLLGQAAAAGLSRDAVNLLERGAPRSPRRDTVALLARALRLSGDERARLLSAAAEARITTAPPRASAFPPGLPACLITLIGREPELAEVRYFVLAQRLLTLIGTGGIGKTSLALAVASALASRFDDRVWLVELAALADGGLVPHAVAAALGVRERPGEPILTTVGRVLGMTRGLLVLDNFEHLLQSCAEVTEALLRAWPGLMVLATSREPLLVGPGALWRVPALTLPDQDDRPPAELARTEAVRLFVE